MKVDFKKIINENIKAILISFAVCICLLLISVLWQKNSAETDLEKETSDTMSGDSETSEKETADINAELTCPVRDFGHDKTKVATGNLIERSGGYHNNGKDEKVIYLTISMTDNITYLDSISQILEERGINATYFIVVKEFNYHPEYYAKLQALIDKGSVIGSHGYVHEYTFNLSDEELTQDITTSFSELNSHLNTEIIYYRPPFGYVSERDLTIATQLGYTVVGYSVGVRDYGNEATKESVYNSLIKGLDSGSVFYFHLKKVTAESLPEFLDYAIDHGYRFAVPGGEPVTAHKPNK